MDKELFDNLKEGLEEAVRISAGEKKPEEIYFVLSPEDIRAIRQGTKLSQKVFAETYQLSVETIRGWEQGKRTPDAAATNYLRLIKADPTGVLEAIRAA